MGKITILREILEYKKYLIRFRDNSFFQKYRIDNLEYCIAIKCREIDILHHLSFLA